MSVFFPFCHRPRLWCSAYVALELPVPLPSTERAGLLFPLCDRFEPYLKHIERAVVDAAAVCAAPLSLSLLERAFHNPTPRLSIGAGHIFPVDGRTYSATSTRVGHPLARQGSEDHAFAFGARVSSHDRQHLVIDGLVTTPLR